MNYKLDHIALNCKDRGESVQYYENHFAGKSTPIRKAGDGKFCAQPSAMRRRSIDRIGFRHGINHDGFVTDDVEQVARISERKREIFAKSATPRQATTLFVKDV